MPRRRTRDMWSVLVIGADGTSYVYGPFGTPAAAEKAQGVIELRTAPESTEVKELQQFIESDFSIYGGA
jgi:hypothetical protein